MNDSPNSNQDAMTYAEFEERLPDLFAGGELAHDERLEAFLESNPDSAALVRDLQTIAKHAKSLFEPVEEPSDDIWTKIQSKLKDPPNDLSE
jgi:hypothetical protein